MALRNIKMQILWKTTRNWDNKMFCYMKKKLQLTAVNHRKIMIYISCSLYLAFEKAMRQKTIISRIQYIKYVSPYIYIWLISIEGWLSLGLIWDILTCYIIDILKYLKLLSCTASVKINKPTHCKSQSN